MNMLKGAQRIVFDELQSMLSAGEPVSIMRIADRSLYHPWTVCRALTQLEESGLIRIQRNRRGTRSTYVIGDGECYNN